MKPNKLIISLVISLFGISGSRTYAYSPATNQDIAIYQAMGTSFFCMAALDNVPFAKSLGIAASTYAQALKGRHKGRVASLGRKTLTEKEMFAASEQQILLRAISACPKGIPRDVQMKIRQAISTNKGSKPPQNQTHTQATSNKPPSTLPTISDTPFNLADPSLQELMQGTPFQWKK